jgi:hypothetical protein
LCCFDSFQQSFFNRDRSGKLIFNMALGEIYNEASRSVGDLILQKGLVSDRT